MVIAPPALYLLLAREHLRRGLEVAAQNVFDQPNGAFTGEISVHQLVDSGITWTILGHSERRVVLQEDDSFVASKTKAAVNGGLSVILCCGESLEQREAGKTVAVVTTQLRAIKEKLDKKDWDKIVIAYEPIWAIGTGKVATTEQAQEVHAAIREWLTKEVGEDVAEKTRILYGGSVNEKNCKDLAQQKDIDGFLVGGASLKPQCEYTCLVFYTEVMLLTRIQLLKLSMQNHPKSHECGISDSPRMLARERHRRNLWMRSFRNGFGCGMAKSYRLSGLL